MGKLGVGAVPAASRALVGKHADAHARFAQGVGMIAGARSPTVARLRARKHKGFAFHRSRNGHEWIDFDCRIVSGIGVA